MSAGGRPVDAVDAIEREWRSERPDLDVSSVAVITRIRRAAKLLRARRSRLLSSLGTDDATLDLLSTIRRSGPPYELTPGQLGERTLVTTGAVSQRLARAEAAGLVARRRSDRDTRSVLVTLTPAGWELLDATVAALFADEEATLAGFEEAERATLVDLLRRYLDTLGSGG
ncbi:MarR family transcriptional regulator [Occultella glacieicola]|uniref:MarR family transcriptional regulator n=1 Tax=Occultella glacieicola TaxID=2518684 RepID=A0ABY2E5X9_9MICO|nr:MarR family transcriptional regulator [Occultella glacieicola]TDE95771.1 MarR family transcriptional regulator [Occultella glacieicola]